jgi:hypothetical protein
VPAFHTHWLVALEAISSAPNCIRAGKDAYKKRTIAYRDACVNAFQKTDCVQALNDAHDDWERKVRGDPRAQDNDQDVLDAMTCFSAYMLGACGPDFWMLHLFGDNITDLAAIIQGGLGIAAGGNINPEGVSMFEPMGGSAPKYTGKNVINPLATICAGGMMMDTLGEPKIAEAIDKAVHEALASKQIKSLVAGKMGMGTREVGDLIAKMVS